MVLPGMEDMLHFKPLDNRGKAGWQKMSNVNCPLWEAKHMLYLLSKSFKSRTHTFAVKAAHIFIKNFFHSEALNSHITCPALNE
jgi:hypothetical protein